MASPEPHPPRRTIRSFVRRQGRLTPAQRRALAQLWPRYGVEAADTPLDVAALFGQHTPVVLEIGFGDGEALCATAAADPRTGYLGVEVHRPGIGRLLRGLHALGLDNVRVLEGDVEEILARRLPDASLDGVRLFFPDPWPKQRHRKRRLVQPPFAELLARKLAPRGRLHIATDWHDYAEHVLEVMSHTEGFANLAPPPGFSPRPAARPVTKYERRARGAGRDVYDLLFERRA